MGRRPLLPLVVPRNPLAVRKGAEQGLPRAGLEQIRVGMRPRLPKLGSYNESQAFISP